MSGLFPKATTSLVLLCKLLHVIFNPIGDKKNCKYITEERATEATFTRMCHSTSEKELMIRPEIFSICNSHFDEKQQTWLHNQLHRSATEHFPHLFHILLRHKRASVY
jgi:hypothetical protein